MVRLEEVTVIAAPVERCFDLGAEYRGACAGECALG